MTGIWNQIESICEAYNGTGNHLLLFILGVLLLINWHSSNKSEKSINDIIVVYILIIGVIFVCPFTAYIIMKYCIGANTYWRMLWLFPIPMIIAHVAVEMVSKTNTKKGNVLVFICVMFLVAFTGQNTFSHFRIHDYVTTSKIPLAVTEVCDYIKNDAEKKNVEEIRAVMPEKFLNIVRQYDATIKMPYGRGGFCAGADTHPIYLLLKKDVIEYELLRDEFDNAECNYIVFIHDGSEREKQMMQLGFENVAIVEGCEIYFRNPN